MRDVPVGVCEGDEGRLKDFSRSTLVCGYHKRVASPLAEKHAIPSILDSVV